MFDRIEYCAMKQKRLSSYLTVWVAWVLPVVLLPFWTIASVFLILDTFEPLLTIYICISTIVLWGIYLLTKPWLLKQVYLENEAFVTIKKAQKEIVFYRQIMAIYSMFNSKFSPIVIEYDENGKRKEITFLPRQSKVLFLLPFSCHPIVKELNEEIKIAECTL